MIVLSDYLFIFADGSENILKERGSSQILVQSPNFYMKEQYF